MPGLYAPGEYDLAGCVVGLVERGDIVDGANVQIGDAVVGLASDGLHTNGYSLARTVLLDDAGMDLFTPVPALGGVTLADALLAPHRCYLKAVGPLLGQAPSPLHAMAHITGGGFVDNIPRVLPAGVGVTINRAAWDVPPLFRLIQQKGNVTEAEMFRVFNMGIGFVLIVDAGAADSVLAQLAASGERAFVLGKTTAGAGITFTA